MKTKLALAFFSALITQSLFAHTLPIHLSQKLNPKHTAVIVAALDEVQNLLPAKLIEGLPKNIELRFEKLSDHRLIPTDLCGEKSANDKGSKGFIYGEYNHSKNLLILNHSLFNELSLGREKSEKMHCQHKSHYDQAISTIIHELTHAYDFNNDHLSNSSEFMRRAGFKKGLLKTKSKNIEAMRSADPYELTNLAEAFAVNMEYFSMDPEFACRKPAMFEYYKKAFNADPFPLRNCGSSNTVMVSSASGFNPMKLDLNRIYRIDYLMASPGRDLSSGFGHSMFRLVICAPERFDVISNKLIKATPYGPKCLEDRLFHLVVSYRANVEDATLNYLKGIFGGYPSMLFVLNFSDVLDEYNRDELRDVVSYPLALSAKDKADFVNKVLEDHWNYRGSYKFVTNNCAVESFDLLKSALDRSQLQGVHSITPKGVLEDLDQLSFVSLKSGNVERFAARSDQLILAYAEAYGASKTDFKKDKKRVLKFISDSLVEDRLSKFSTFSKTKIESMDLHTEMTFLKKSLVKASSFSVLEQQILRSKTAEYRKKAAEIFMKKDQSDPRVKQIVEEAGPIFKQNFSELSRSGYGVPLTNELLTRRDIELKMEQSKETIANIEVVLKELLPNEMSVLEAINTNVSSFNQKSLGIRKIYRQKLDRYIAQVLTNLSHEDSSRSLLIDSLQSNESLNKVRQLLDSELVSEKEILDAKLRKLIEERLN